MVTARSENLLHVCTLHIISFPFSTTRNLSTMDPHSSTLQGQQTLDQQTLETVNTYIINTASMLNTLAENTQNELSNITKTLERLQKQIEVLEKTVQQPDSSGHGDDVQQGDQPRLS